MKRPRTQTQDSKETPRVPVAPKKIKESNPQSQKKTLSKNYGLKHRLPDFTGTMKKGFLSPDRRHIYLTFKEHGKNPELLHEFQLMKNLKQIGLPTVGHLQLRLNQQDGNLVLQEDYIPNAVLIKPQIPRDHHKLVQFAAKDPRYVWRQLDHIHKRLEREHLLIEDLQFIVARDNLRLVVIDPYNIIRLFPETKTWSDGTRLATRGYARKLVDFKEQQKWLAVLAERVRGSLPLNSH